MVTLDNTIVNLALPSIQHDFGASTSGLQWTIDAYNVVLASLLMLFGSVADRVGRRRVFQIGLVLFTAGSLLCGLAGGIGQLVAFRIVQAVGGAMLNPVAMSIVTNTFTDPRQRARAIGIWAGVFGVSMALGPVVGGTLAGLFGWRSIFWLNVPFGIAAVVLTAVFVPDSKAAKPRRVDPVGQVLVVVALGSATYAIIEAPSTHLAATIGCFALAVLAVVCLVPYEYRRADPLIDPRFFGSIPFSGATLTAICGSSVLGGFLFLNAIYLQDVRDLSPLQAGLLTLPTAIAIIALSPVSGRIVSSRGPRLPLTVSGAALMAGSLLCVGLGNNSPLGMLVVTYLTFGAGFGLINPPITHTAVSGMPREQAGVAAAVASTSRQVGAVLGVAVLGTVVRFRLHGPLPTGFATASHAAWWITAAGGAVVLALGFVTTTHRARRTTFDEAAVATTARATR